METSIESVETRLYNIKQEKIFAKDIAVRNSQAEPECPQNEQEAIAENNTLK